MDGSINVWRSMQRAMLLYPFFSLDISIKRPSRCLLSHLLCLSFSLSLFPLCVYVFFVSSHILFVSSVSSVCMFFSVSSHIIFVCALLFVFFRPPRVTVDAIGSSANPTLGESADISAGDGEGNVWVFYASTRDGFSVDNIQLMAKCVACVSLRVCVCMCVLLAFFLLPPPRSLGSEHRFPRVHQLGICRLLHLQKENLIFTLSGDRSRAWASSFSCLVRWRG